LPTPQQALDTVLALPAINRHFDVADLLLKDGARRSGTLQLSR